MASSPPTPPPTSSTPIAPGRWWHKGGYFTIWVTEIVENDKGRWIQFFSEANCDDTYLEFKDAHFGEGIVKKHWFDSPFLQVHHEGRFLRTYVPNEVPAKDITIKHFNEHGQEILYVQP